MHRPRKAPPYCQGFLDRHGRARWYFRKPGCKRVPLPGLPWSPDFMAAYEAATKGAATAGEARTKPGTITDLIARYYQTGDYLGLSPATQKTYRGVIERFRAEHGDKRVAKMERKHVRKIVGDRAATPAAANNMLRMIRMLMRHAVDFEMRDDDPTRDVRSIKSRSEGFRTWAEDDIAAFAETHPPGSRAHLALMLLLYTGQRRGDVVRMGWQHIREGALSIRQEKTGRPSPSPWRRRCKTRSLNFQRTGSRSSRRRKAAASRQRASRIGFVSASNRPAPPRGRRAASADCHPTDSARPPLGGSPRPVIVSQRLV